MSPSTSKNTICVTTSEKETTENGDEALQDETEEQKSLPIEEWYVD